MSETQETAALGKKKTFCRLYKLELNLHEKRTVIFAVKPIVGTPPYQQHTIASDDLDYLFN